MTRVRSIPFALYDISLLGFTVALSLWGVLAVASAAPDDRFWQAQLIWWGIAAGVASVFQVFRRKSIFDLAYPLYIVSLLLLSLVLVFGETINGAKAWLILGPFSFQPSELAKIGLLLAMAQLLREKTLVGWRDYLAPLALALPAIGLVAAEPDLGGALVMSAMTFGVLFIRGLPTRHILIAGIAGLLLIPVIWPHLEPYQQQRVMVIFDPAADPLGAGYQVTQSMIAVGSGGVFGKGYGAGSQTQLGYIPLRHSDFIFAVISEETGLIGASLLLLLFAGLFYRLAAMAGEAREVRDHMVIGGVMTLLGFQVLVNVAVVLGLAPVTGITLPFISYGGTSLVITYLAIAIALVLHRDRYIAF